MYLKDLLYPRSREHRANRQNEENIVAHLISFSISKSASTSQRSAFYNRFIAVTEKFRRSHEGWGGGGGLGSDQ